MPSWRSADSRGRLSPQRLSPQRLSPQRLSPQKLSPQKLSPRGFWLRFLRFAFKGALQGLIEGGFGFFVFVVRDAALFVFDFELEELFFQGFEQHGCV